MTMKPTKEKLQRMYEENEKELLRLDEIEKLYHENPHLDLEKRVRLLLSLEQTRQQRLKVREALKKELASQ